MKLVYVNHQRDNVIMSFAVHVADEMGPETMARLREDLKAWVELVMDITMEAGVCGLTNPALLLPTSKS